MHHFQIKEAGLPFSIQYNTMKKEQTTYLLLLATICAATLFTIAGLTLFHTKGEPREAIVAYTMLDTNNWILPENIGGEFAYKPPFLHWCIAAFASIFGTLNEYVSRMPSMLAATIIALAGFLFNSKQSNIKLAFLTSLITLSNFEIHRAALNCRVDMVLTACIVLALYSLYRWYEQGYHSVPWLAILFMSLGTLTKGPVAIILPCLVMGVMMLIRKVNFWRIFLSFTGIAILSCILPSLWYIAAYQQAGENFLNLVIEENFGRFLGKMSYPSHENPWYYNVMTLIAGFTPYTLLAFISLFFLHYKKINIAPLKWWNNLKNYIKKVDDASLFNLLAIILIFIFYCIPKSKRSVYLMPMYPFIAYFLAEYILWLFKNKHKVLHIYGNVIYVLCLLLTLVFIAIKIGIVPDSIFQGKHATDNIAFLHALKNTTIHPLQVITILLPPVYAIWAFIQKKYTPLTVVGITFILFLALDSFYQPTVLNIKSDKSFAKQIIEKIPEGKIYSFVNVGMMHFFTINFYTNNRVDVWEYHMPQEGYVIVGEKDFEALPNKEKYVLTEVMHSKRRGCDVKQIMYLYHFKKKTTEQNIIAE